MADILFLPFGRCSQLPYFVTIKTCFLYQPPPNPALPRFILIGIKIGTSFRNYLISNINNAMDKMDEDVDRESISSIDELKDKIQELADSYVDTFLAKNDIDAEPMVDGKIGFLYLNKNGMPTVALRWEKYFQHIVEKYNKIYKEQMPKVTPHVCRHTYCSHCASSGVNPKHLQYLMGHSDIGVTLILIHTPILIM